MVLAIVLAAGLIGMLCVFAHTLATHALPLAIGLTVAQFAYCTGAGPIGAGLVGLVAGAVSFVFLAFLFAILRPPILRLIVALIFTAPAAIAGYALVYGMTAEAVPSEEWRHIFSIAGSIAVGVSALMRLASGIGGPVR